MLRGGRERPRCRLALAAASALAALALLPACASAADPQFVWAGHHFPRNWSEAGNWEGGLAPAVGKGPLDLTFPLSACEPWPALCPGTTDDLHSVLIGMLTLQARVIRWAAGSQLEMPPAELHAENYSVAGSETLDLVGGIDLKVSQEGTGEGLIANGGTTIWTPISLGGENTWSVGPAPGENLNLAGTVQGAHALAVTLATGDGLQFEKGVEVGPVTISGPHYAYVALGGSGEAGFNSEDGEPVTLEGVMASDAGRLGPLTLDAGAWFNPGTRVAGGATQIEGDLHVAAGSTLGFELPGSAEWTPTRIMASGHARLEGATLQTGEGCVAPGSTYALIEASGGVSGDLVTPEGEPIDDGQVLPGTPEACGPGESAPPLRIDYSADAVTATALASVPLAQSTVQAPAPASTAEKSASGSVTAYASAARMLLTQALAKTGHKQIGALLRHGGETTIITAPLTGTLNVLWRARRGGRAITLAVGVVHLNASSADGRLRIVLTRAGRSLLRHTGRLRGESIATLRAPGHSTITQSAPLQLRH